MLNRKLNLKSLLDPISEDEFARDYLGHKPLHIPGSSQKFKDVFTWNRLNKLLNATSIWTASKLRLVYDQTVLPPGEYCRPAMDQDTGQIMRPIPALVSKHIERGASININEIQTLDDGLASVAASLGMAFCAHVNCNLYASRQSVQAFPSHFDTSDVYVIHISGTKQWNVYANRFDEAAYVDGYTSGSFPDEYHAQHKGDVLMQPVLTPGDFLYIPRGFYHDALASSDASLHVTFAVDEVRGLVVGEILAPMLAAEPLFRAPLPDPDDTVAHDAHIRRLGERLTELLSQQEVVAHIRERQKNQAFWDLPGFALPAPEFDQLFRRMHRDARLDKNGQNWVLSFGGRELPIPNDRVAFVRWILDGEYFETDQLVRAFKPSQKALALNTIEVLMGNGFIEPMEKYAV